MTEYCQPDKWFWFGRYRHKAAEKTSVDVYPRPPIWYKDLINVYLSAANVSDLRECSKTEGPFGKCSATIAPVITVISYIYS